MIHYSLWEKRSAASMYGNGAGVLRGPLGILAGRGDVVNGTLQTHEFSGTCDGLVLLYGRPSLPKSTISITLSCSENDRLATVTIIAPRREMRRTPILLGLLGHGFGRSEDEDDPTDVFGAEVCNDAGELKFTRGSTKFKGLRVRRSHEVIYDDGNRPSGSGGGTPC